MVKISTLKPFLAGNTVLNKVYSYRAQLQAVELQLIVKNAIRKGNPLEEGLRRASEDVFQTP